VQRSRGPAEASPADAQAAGYQAKRMNILTQSSVEMYPQQMRRRGR